ncbi:uncharacterized protein TNCV_4985481 [Trichonephila clavipes]|nr:uncharacterized protein TNCV_4985481 [Trichonephila clavipes]
MSGANVCVTVRHFYSKHAAHNLDCRKQRLFCFGRKHWPYGQKNRPENVNHVTACLQRFVVNAKIHEETEETEEEEVVCGCRHFRPVPRGMRKTVWCALWAGGIIGPYFFKNDEGHNVTVNGDRYRAMITNFFIPELNNHVVQELWFQQDGATCHTARATIDLLKDTFGDRLISRFGPVNWPTRSCDLTPLDYFLWGYVKSLVYADKPQTLDHLEDNIHPVIADIRPQMLEKVIENWTSRLDYIRASRGSPMPEIIFKM